MAIVDSIRTHFEPDMSKPHHVSGPFGPGLRLLAALLGAACASLALPSAGLWALAPLAPAGLVLACAGTGPAGGAALGFAYGTAAAWGTYAFMFQLPAFNLAQAFVLSTYLALFPTVFAALLPLLRRSRLPLPWGAAALWTALDVLRARAGFLAFPWGTLGQSQAPDLPLLQAASVLGEEGVTFLVVLAGVALAESATKRRLRPLAVPGATVALALVLGSLRLSAAAPAPTLRVAAIQPAIGLSERATPRGEKATLERLERLTREAAQGRPAVIVWPETAVRAAIGQENSFEWVKGLADRMDVTLIVGASQAEKFANAGSNDYLLRQANVAVAFRPHAEEPETYRKALLVPFAEYLPAPSFPWPKKLVGKSFDVVPGESPGLFRLPDGTPVAPLICWENLFSGFVLRASRDARLLVQLTNDAHFGESAEPLQHGLATVVRAVENGVPAVVSSNAGPSFVADARGRILARVPGPFSRGVAAAAVAPGTGQTPFARGGRHFGAASAAAAAAAVLDGMRRRRDSRP